MGICSSCLGGKDDSDEVCFDPEKTPKQSHAYNLDRLSVNDCSTTLMPNLTTTTIRGIRLLHHNPMP